MASILTFAAVRSAVMNHLGSGGDGMFRISDTDIRQVFLDGGEIKFTWRDGDGNPVFDFKGSLSK